MRSSRETNVYRKTLTMGEIRSAVRTCPGIAQREGLVRPANDPRPLPGGRRTLHRGARPSVPDAPEEGGYWVMTLLVEGRQSRFVFVMFTVPLPN